MNEHEHDWIRQHARRTSTRHGGPGWGVEDHIATATAVAVAPTH